MNLGENLQTLRKMKGLSQEELADKLEVSRQAVSKWESGSGYPETEKIINICELFGCTMDELIRGKISNNLFSDKKKYERIMNRFSKGISFGVFLILIGVTIMLFIMSFNPNEEKYTTFGVLVLLLFVFFATPIFIVLGIKDEEFKKKNRELPNFYSETELEKANNKFIFLLASSISLILLGVITLVALYSLKVFTNEMFPVAIFLIFITIAAPFIVYAGINKSKYDIELYNKINAKEAKQSEILIGKICATIMLIATIIYFILGFIFKLWSVNWIVYPIGGMCCGIVGTILNKEE